MAAINDPVVVFWFRRDLRVADNKGLEAAAKTGHTLLPLFIYDTHILKSLPRDDARVEFIHQSVGTVNDDLGGHLHVHEGRPLDVFRELIKKHKISCVITNEDYEPYAVARDEAIEKFLRSHGVGFERHKDQVIFSPTDVVKDDQTPYKVYGAYAKRWRARLEVDAPKPAQSQKLVAKARFVRGTKPPSLSAIGFKSSGLKFPSPRPGRDIIEKYHERRNMMGENATSRIGIHLRFGTVSVRKLLAEALEVSDVFVSELIWREFFMSILAHFPHTVEKPFDERFERVKWVNDRAQFKRWCEGKTGFPIVDAGMRELNTTGFMHNRARMITASFLTKHLLIDWTWGERYFALKLLDYEQAANIGNWQWVAGCGCDAAPYFRVFSPELQAKKFDPKGEYVKRWVPEVDSSAYPEPIVEHAWARARALKVLKQAVKGT